MLTKLTQRFIFKRLWKTLPSFLLGLLSLGLVLLMHRLPVVAQSSVTQATITEILEGNQVYIQNRQARVNDVARLQEQIRTGQARAQVRFNNNAIARLSRNSTLLVGQCGAQVQKGSVLLNGQVSACTSTITAAVRGTTYILRVDEEGEEEIQVLEGELEVTSLDDQKPQSVRGGEQLRFSRRRPRREVRQLARQEFENVLNSPLVRGYGEDLPSIGKIERVFKRRFPNAPFPLLRQARLLSPHRGHFSLAILQDRPSLSQVIARVTLKSKRANGFLSERFVGDYLYQPNQTANFARGLNPSDRVVVRLFDPLATPENQLIGYSEFELLDDFAAVNIVLPDQPSAYGTVRTVVGLDSDQNGRIDPNVTVYDYFSQLTYPASRELRDAQVIFLTNNRDLNLSLFDPRELPIPSRNTTYFQSFTEGSFTLVNTSLPLFYPELEPTISALPSQLNQPIRISPDGSSTYYVPSQILNYRR